MRTKQLHVTNWFEPLQKLKAELGLSYRLKFQPFPCRQYCCGSLYCSLLISVSVLSTFLCADYISGRTGAVVSVVDYGPRGLWFDTWPGRRSLWH